MKQDSFIETVNSILYYMIKNHMIQLCSEQTEKERVHKEHFFSLCPAPIIDIMPVNESLSHKNTHKYIVDLDPPRVQKKRWEPGIQGPAEGFRNRGRFMPEELMSQPHRLQR